MKMFGLFIFASSKKLTEWMQQVTEWSSNEITKIVNDDVIVRNNTIAGPETEIQL